MNQQNFQSKFSTCFSVTVKISDNYLDESQVSEVENQQQTNAVFSEKWSKYDQSDKQENLYAFQRDWYLELYGFGNEVELRNFLADKMTIFDAGCGLGYKAAWFAELAPHALVIGMDFSEAAAPRCGAFL